MAKKVKAQRSLTAVIDLLCKSEFAAQKFFSFFDVLDLREAGLRTVGDIVNYMASDSADVPPSPLDDAQWDRITDIIVRDGFGLPEDFLKEWSVSGGSKEPQKVSPSANDNTPTSDLGSKLRSKWQEFKDEWKNS